MVTEIMSALCCSFMWESVRRSIIIEKVEQVEVTRTESMLVQQKRVRYRPTSSLPRGSVDYVWEGSYSASLQCPGVRGEGKGEGDIIPKKANIIFSDGRSPSINHSGVHELKYSMKQRYTTFASGVGID